MPNSDAIHERANLYQIMKLLMDKVDPARLRQWEKRFCGCRPAGGSETVGTRWRWWRRLTGRGTG